jgi:hypothetical protein
MKKIQSGISLSPVQSGSGLNVDKNLSRIRTLPGMSNFSSFGRLSGSEMSKPATILNWYQGDVSPSPRVALFHTLLTAEQATRVPSSSGPRATSGRRGTPSTSPATKQRHSSPSRSATHSFLAPRSPVMVSKVCSRRRQGLQREEEDEVHHALTS